MSDIQAVDAMRGAFIFSEETVIALETIDSTNNEALRRLEAGTLPLPCLITAQQQTQGRGRCPGRTWLGERGNFFATYVTKRPSHFPITHLPLLVACAIYRSVRSFVASTSISLKWPNDVLIAGMKLAGALIETGPRETALIGIGVNIVSAPTLPSHTRKTTHLNAWTPYPVTVEEYTTALLSALKAVFDVWEKQGFSAILTEWQNCSQEIGRSLSVRVGQEQMHGIFERLDQEGRLILRFADGRTRAVASGEAQ
ncbi:MAG: biotin--[acetyl-CoA-carboxylase] ligase [Holosporales bacterium]|jgi:BirA family biotin operon repressor/biotin-[acetyl-CoA-carboxylase] ligase|nr:biotin--[acetyl-CoA-carboxylase] ligase [Holosporales bacterium]